MVFGFWILAAVVALGNHFYFASLHDTNVSLHNQFWVSVLKNILARVVQFCLIISANTACVALIWSILPGQCLAIKSVDAALRLPAVGPFFQILFSRAFKPLSSALFWSATLFTLAFVTITPPAALTVEPMEPIPRDLEVPYIDFSADPRLYTVISDGWRYVSPSNRLRRLVRNMVTSNNVVVWEPPVTCRFGCSYNVTYPAPVLRCADYVPDQSGSGLDSSDGYQGTFDISSNALTFNVTVWPMYNGTHTSEGSNSSLTGTRCTFHNGTYTATVHFGGSNHNAVVTNSTIISNDVLPGTSLGLTNASACPRDANWLISDPYNTPPCARVQMNTWAFIDAFASSLSGIIVIYSQTGSIGPETRFANNALMPNLDYLFSIHELSQSFDLAPWVKRQGLGSALESLFANSTLSLTKDALAQNWTALMQNAHVVPFVNRFKYNPVQLWWTYGSALLTVLGAAWAARDSRQGGDVPLEETSLSRILATTRDESFRPLEEIGENDMDEVIVRYEGAQVGNECRMAFTVVSERGQRGLSEVEGVGLLQKT